jgi:hypothetical protein
MLGTLAQMSPSTIGFVVALLAAVYAYAYAKFVLKVSTHESNKAFFKTLVAGAVAAGTVALLVRQAPAPPAPLTAEPFFAPL